MTLDKFYTAPEAAEKFISNVSRILDLEHFDNIIEPSAGDGALLKHLPSRTIALDLAPEADGITQQDFLTYEFPLGRNLVVMNPPFGKQSKLAIEFFNKCAGFDLDRLSNRSEAIACIIPVTWEKYSVHKQLDSNWHLVFNERLPEKSFLADGEPYSVRCTQQIWVRSDLNTDDWSGYVESKKV